MLQQKSTQTHDGTVVHVVCRCRLGESDIRLFLYDFCNPKKN